MKIIHSNYLKEIRSKDTINLLSHKFKTLKQGCKKILT